MDPIPITQTDLDEMLRALEGALRARAAMKAAEARLAKATAKL